MGVQIHKGLIGTLLLSSTFRGHMFMPYNTAPASVAKSAIHTNQVDYSVWRYFLGLESEFIKSLDYVEFSDRNKNTFSNSFARQFVSICSEFEGLTKKLGKHKTGNTLGNVGQYKEFYLEYYPDLPSQSVIVDEYKYPEIIPFASWAQGKLVWWDSYTEIKHKGSSYHEYGNLSNVVNALAALLLIESIYHIDVLKAPIYGAKLLRVEGMLEAMMQNPAPNGFFTKK